jgi:hypothetical protein
MWFFFNLFSILTLVEEDYYQCYHVYSWIFSVFNPVLVNIPFTQLRVAGVEKGFEDSSSASWEMGGLSSRLHPSSCSGNNCWTLPGTAWGAGLTGVKWSMFALGQNSAPHGSPWFLVGVLEQWAHCVFHLNCLLTCFYFYSFSSMSGNLPLPLVGLWMSWSHLSVCCQSNPSWSPRAWSTQWQSKTYRWVGCNFALILLKTKQPVRRRPERFSRSGVIHFHFRDEEIEADGNQV